MSKSPSLGFLKKKTDTSPSPIAPDPVQVSEPGVALTTTQVKSSGKEIPSWQVGKRAVTVWVDEEQFLRLNEISKSKRKPVRRLMFEAINMLLPVYDKLPVEDT